MAVSAKMPPSDVDIPAQQIDARKREIARADHDRNQKIPSVAGMDGTRKKNTMMIPCMVNSLL